MRHYFKSHCGCHGILLLGVIHAESGKVLPEMFICDAQEHIVKPLQIYTSDDFTFDEMRDVAKHFASRIPSEHPVLPVNHGQA